MCIPAVASVQKSLCIPGLRIPGYRRIGWCLAVNVVGLKGKSQAVVDSGAGLRTAWWQFLLPVLPPGFNSLEGWVTGEASYILPLSAMSQPVRYLYGRYCNCMMRG